GVPPPVERAAAGGVFGGGPLPFDSEGRVLPVFERWIEHDPVRRAADFAEAVRSWRGVWLGVCSRDEYFLDLGASALRDALLAAGLPQDRMQFELVDGGHGCVSHRYPLSLVSLVAQRGARPS